MNILLIHQYYLGENAGGGSRWNEMTRFWASKGHSITVLAGMTHYTTGEKDEQHKGKYFSDDQYAKNIRVIWSHVSEQYNVSFVGRLRAYLSFVFSSSYAGLFKAKGSYDVIIVSSPPLFVGITARILSIFKRRPFIFEVRDLWPESAIDAGIVKNRIIIRMAYWFEKRFYKKASLITVLTPAFRDTLITKKKIDPDKILFIPNAADFSISDKLLSSFDVESFKKKHALENKFIVIYVGAHGVANHLIQLVEAAEILKTEPVLFLLVGDGMQKSMLIEKARQLQLENVRFIDPVSKSEVFKYILASDIGASVLKKADTFKTVYSNKTFDYMACKKPILMAIDGISRELVETADAGLFVEPENPLDFADKIRHYLNNTALGQIQGENGYVYAKAHFDRESLAGKYLEELQKHFPGPDKIQATGLKNQREPV